MKGCTILVEPCCGVATKTRVWVFENDPTPEYLLETLRDKREQPTMSKACKTQSEERQFIKTALSRYADCSIRLVVENMTMEAIHVKDSCGHLVNSVEKMVVTTNECSINLV